jgi:glutamate dehydrogenase/leucine dehydrogenase
MPVSDVSEAPEVPEMPEVAEELNPFVIAQLQCDNAARYLPGLDPGVFEYLKRPDKLTTVEFPIETTSRGVRNFVGYRAIHSRVRGPGVNAG